MSRFPLLSAIRDSRALRETVSRTFLGSLLASPQGRAYALVQAAIAEGTDEGAVFEHVATRVADGELQRMVKKHAEDEERHAALFFGCADRQGVGRPEIPKELRVLELLDARIGVFGRPVATDEDVMMSYLVLQVIEERAIEQFATMEPVMRRYDSRTADVLAGIGKDEERHLLYCRAITKRYAPNEAVREQKLAALREAEAHAFREHQQNGIAYIMGRADLLTPAARLFWRAALDLLSRRADLPYTRFHGDLAGPVALAA